MLLSWHNFSNLKFPSPLNWLSINHTDRKELFLIMNVLVCAFIYPYLVQVCTNPIQLYTFRCRHRWTLQLTIRRCNYPDVEHSSELGRPSCFWGSLPIIFYLRYRFDLVEYVSLIFHFSFHFRLCIVFVLARIRLMQLWTASFIWLFLY